MKKTTEKIVKIVSIITLAAIFAGCNKKSADAKTESKEVTIYTYDSFAGEWGPGPELTKKFEEQTGYKLNIVDCGDAVQALSRAILEKNAVQADVIVGLDNNTSSKAINEGIIEEYKTKNSDSIPKDLFEALQDKGNFVTPYDFSHFALIFDSKSNTTPPTSLEDLAKPEYAKKLILMDPRTSTPGLGFVAWTVSVFGDKVIDYWKTLKPSILMMAPGWSAGYGSFTKGEAPLVISYTTSPAYHVEYGEGDERKALIFDEGHSWQVEGAAILKNAPNKKGAEAFIDFLTSEEGQSILPLTQWMYPANKNVKLPESYEKAAPIPERTLIADPEKVQSAVEEIMKILSE
ncbi:MAG: thiamine ABC transporter substrate-binding protein [Treponema sp.]|nr:thiamine ABC transporter substrate-binding protein [Treponema sp.]